MATSLDFFAEYQRVFLTFHILAVVIGMGGATIADLLFFNFLKDFKISKKETEILGIVSNMIMGAMFLLYITGICIYLSNIPVYSVSPAFFSKTVIVAVLTINGVLMHSYVAPRMIHISFLKKEFGAKHVIHRLRGVAFAMGAVSFSSWYFVFFLSMLKRMLPAWVSYGHILGAYFATLLLAVAASQIVQKMYHRTYLISIR